MFNEPQQHHSEAVLTIVYILAALAVFALGYATRAGVFR